MCATLAIQEWRLVTAQAEPSCLSLVHLRPMMAQQAVVQVPCPA